MNGLSYECAEPRLAPPRPAPPAADRIGSATSQWAAQATRSGGNNAQCSIGLDWIGAAVRCCGPTRSEQTGWAAARRHKHYSAMSSYRLGALEGIEAWGFQHTEECHAMQMRCDSALRRRTEARQEPPYPVRVRVLAHAQHRLEVLLPCNRVELGRVEDAAHSRLGPAQPKLSKRQMMSIHA